MTKSFKEPTVSDLSVSAGYTKFQKGEKVKAITRHDGYCHGKFVGIDRFGVVTVSTGDGGGFDAWECNVYKV